MPVIFTSLSSMKNKKTAELNFQYDPWVREKWFFQIITGISGEKKRIKIS
jgi:hypothetical protein